MGWSAFEKHVNITLKRGIEPMCSFSFKWLLRNLASYNRTRKKTEKCAKRNGEENTQHYVER